MVSVYYFSIARINIAIEVPFEFEISEDFQPFLQAKQLCDTKVCFEKTSQIKVNVPEKISVIEYFSVFSCKKEFFRAYHKPCSHNDIYAIGSFVDDRTEKVIYREQDEGLLKTVRSCFMHISFEKHMLKCGAMVLHASLIQTEFGGILFTGPSGIGKSTQANLWSKYRYADILNGDRAIIRNIDSKWMAYGSPYAGSSHIYLNRGCEIAAIVILQKSDKNIIKKIDPVLAFQKLYSQMLLNPWDEEFIIRIAEYIEELIKVVPVYLFSCRPDEEAVEVLAKSLKRSI